MTLTSKLQSNPPSRELDCRIYCELNDLKFVKIAKVGEEVCAHSFMFAMDNNHTEQNIDLSIASPIAAYTTSIDAALTLLPDGWRVNLSEWDHEALRDRGPWQCVLSPAGKGFFDFEGPSDARCDNARTPALALCIAILKARAE